MSIRINIVSTILILLLVCHSLDQVYGNDPCGPLDKRFSKPNDDDEDEQCEDQCDQKSDVCNSSCAPLDYDCPVGCENALVDCLDQCPPAIPNGAFANATEPGRYLNKYNSIREISILNVMRGVHADDDSRSTPTPLDKKLSEPNDECEVECQEDWVICVTSCDSIYDPKKKDCAYACDDAESDCLKRCPSAILSGTFVNMTEPGQ
ncbi:uncharacterized protein A4U43_C08F8090 [Asparagus officinalis]|nr:uncharacterized protein A4U43_C08F8090 [Asparagus officinalis]